MTPGSVSGRLPSCNAGRTRSGPGDCPLPPNKSLPYPAAFDTCLDILAREGVPYALIGAVALAVLGVPRATYDVDFLAALPPLVRLKLRRAFAKAGYQVDRRWHARNPLLNRRVLRFRKRKALVDLLAVADSHERFSLKRRRLHREGPRQFYTVAPEDFVLMKLKAQRARDWDDILTVLARHRAKIDWPYLRAWARRLGLSSEVTYLRKLTKV